MDHAGSLGRIIHRDHRVVVATVLLREGSGSDVSGERSDMPRTDAEKILHRKSLAGMCGHARYR